MKILFVVNNFNFGGPQKSLLNLLYELEGKDVEVDLIILNNQQQLKEYLPNYVNIVEIHSKYSLLMLSKENIIKNMCKNFLSPIFNLKVIAFLVKSLLKLQENVKAKQIFWMKNKWKSKKQKKAYDYAIGVSGGHSIYYIVDYVDAKEKIGWIRTDYRVLKRNHDIDATYFNQLDGMLSVSSLCADIFEDLFSIKPRVFYNSLPIKLYQKIQEHELEIDSRVINICTICRLDYGKGLDLLIDAAKILKDKNIKVIWYVVGTGKLENWLKEAIEENQLQDMVKMLGFVFNTGSIVKKVDFMVHPSRFEGKSNTVDEALYFNKPVIATNFETVYEQIENKKNGYIVPMEGIEIANKIIDLVNDSSLLEDMKENIKRDRLPDNDKGAEFLNTLANIRKD